MFQLMLPSYIRLPSITLARPCAGLVLAFGCCLWLSLNCNAAGPFELTSEEAAARVADALDAEAEGDFLTRQRLLVEADQADDFPPAKWHRGLLRESDGSWTDIAASIAGANQDESLREYERRRASLTDTLGNHLALATWCAKQELMDQCRSHLHRVLAFDPDHAAARRALGYRNFDGEWMSPRELMELQRRALTAEKSVRDFGPQVRSIAVRMSGSAQERELARRELDGLRDPAAVPAVEFVFSSPEEAPSLVAIGWLAGIDHVEASQALARFSLFHPSESVRYRSAEQLRQRPLYDFVPDMLGMLSSPVNAMIVPVFDRTGALTGYRQAFSQEKFDKTELSLLDRQFIRSPDSTRRRAQQMRRGARLSVSLQDVVDQTVENSLRAFAANEARTRTAAMQRDNQATQLRNARVAEVLSQVAAREFSGEAKEMWKWWDQLNETRYQDYKPERYQLSSLSDRVADYIAPPPPVAQVATSGECFVAGTEVVTRRGQRRIEQIVVGDLVLSRHVRSGELCWKPVLRTTTRPPEKTLSVAIGDERLRCTSGHLFWVSGDGWKKASQLTAGDILHAAQEPMVVLKVKPEAIAPTYNLEVADTGTYFVGKAMVMTHDVLPRQHNRQRVPGQQLVQLVAD